MIAYPLCRPLLRPWIQLFHKQQKEQISSSKNLQRYFFNKTKYN